MAPPITPLEKSDFSENTVNLHNQEICTSCDENLLGTFKCNDCNDFCVRNVTKLTQD